MCYRKNGWPRCHNDGLFASVAICQCSIPSLLTGLGVWYLHTQLMLVKIKNWTPHKEIATLSSTPHVEYRDTRTEHFTQGIRNMQWLGLQVLRLCHIKCVNFKHKTVLMVVIMVPTGLFHVRHPAKLKMSLKIAYLRIQIYSLTFWSHQRITGRHSANGIYPWQCHQSMSQMLTAMQECLWQRADRRQ